MTRVGTRGIRLATVGAGALCAAVMLTHAVARDAHGDRLELAVPLEGPIPPDARSVVINDRDGITIMTAPSFDETIAGRTLPHASYAVLETRPSSSACRRGWVRIGPDAWLCSDHASFSMAPPDTHDASVPPPGELLPFSYAFTSRDHTRAYRAIEPALAQSSDAADYDSWEANWGFATDAFMNLQGARVVRSRSGAYLRRGDLYRASPSEFAGGAFWDLAASAPGVPFGWIAVGGTLMYAQPDEAGAGVPIRRLSRVDVYAVRAGPRGHSWARIGPASWVRADHVRWISPAPPPSEVNVAARERWIDVDLTSQTLLAYEGAEPVYATMVSSGERYPTPPGLFRVAEKFLARTMDNTESARVSNHFNLGDVPYVQFFDHDRALHGVYWHDGFGVPHSHGCINLSPRDADWLFHFTRPVLPVGWGWRSVPRGTGTVVRVRGRYVIEAT